MAAMAVRCVLLLAMAVCSGAVRVPVAAKKAVSVAAVQSQQAPIRPPLDPESHKKFFNKDYPDDHQPKNTHNFTYPYPKFQADKVYEKDFVKDENGDNGQWKTQMDYDIARHKMRKEREEMEKAKAEEEMKTEKVKEAEVKAKAAAEKAAAAKKEAEEAAAARAKAETEAGSEVSKTKEEMTKEEEEMTKKVVEAEEEYKKEKEQFANCQKELEDAKAKLEQLTNDKESLEKTDTEQAKMLKIDRTLIDQEKAKESAAEQKLSVAEKERSAAEVEFAKVKAENDAAMKEIAKEEAEMKAAQAQLANAEAKLSSLREAGPIRTGGPVVNTGDRSKRKDDKDSAFASTVSMTVALVMASAVLSNLSLL
mmetsp:Transcript_23985/g.61034  ORF Transcript_23985/g.61034 Transcript_23985/m.61034 type:complete len:366 (+) Transcript_23985:73-1170(+)